MNHCLGCWINKKIWFIDCVEPTLKRAIVRSVMYDDSNIRACVFLSPYFFFVFRVIFVLTHNFDSKNEKTEVTSFSSRILHSVVLCVCVPKKKNQRTMGTRCLGWNCSKRMHVRFYTTHEKCEHYFQPVVLFIDVYLSPRFCKILP